MNAIEPRIHVAVDVAQRMNERDEAPVGLDHWTRPVLQEAPAEVLCDCLSSCVDLGEPAPGIRLVTGEDVKNVGSQTPVEDGVVGPVRPVPQAFRAARTAVVDSLVLPAADQATAIAQRLLEDAGLGEVGVAPVSWTPDDWEVKLPRKEFTWGRPSPPTRRSSGLRPYALRAPVVAPCARSPRTSAARSRACATG